ncbi:hypothetical protein IscW_ISCW000930 [Ixodes scapularis]|uniref:Uncharacterized protein n=1 Tax=Ixodes scapularis TaxID=6945 RepID=B7P3I3_IXOSC|nr:hypothetical protein IscW_ISCW000930 [Ixodes scapularis]|eukprot:XP_002404261.1 hypothetical protein IscW_ISCW000930 [Ixodes scapularis]
MHQRRKGPKEGARQGQAYGQRPSLKDKQSKERSRDGNQKRKSRQQLFEHAKRSTDDVPHQMLDRRAIWVEHERERKGERFPEDQDEDNRDKVQARKEKK